MQLADEAPEWRALADLCGELRRLNDLVTTRHVDDGERAELAAAVAGWAARLEPLPARDKLADMQTRPHLDRVYRDQPAPLDVVDGEPLEFDPFSVVGGALHPSSMDLRLTWEDARRWDGSPSRRPIPGHRSGSTGASSPPWSTR